MALACALFVQPDVLLLDEPVCNPHRGLLGGPASPRSNTSAFHILLSSILARTHFLSPLLTLLYPSIHPSCDYADEPLGRPILHVARELPAGVPVSAARRL